MNKTKFFSSLLVAVLFATTSVFVSCKDYDDDIKNLQSQIDKAALKADLDALSTKLAGVESTANAAKTTAENALAKANANATEIAAVKATAEKAAKDAAEGLAAVAKAQNTADAAQAAAAAAQKTADNAAAAAAAAQKTADNAVAAAAAAQKTADAAATKKELEDAVAKLQKAVDDLAAVAATKKELADAKTELQAYAKAQADAAQEVALAAAKAAADAAAAAQKTADDATAAAGKAQSTADQNAETIKTLATQTALETLSTELKGEIEGLKTTLAGITGVEEMAELVEIIGNFDTIVEKIFSAVTSVELIATYSGTPDDADEAIQFPLGALINSVDGWGKLDFVFGKQKWTDKFGDKEDRFEDADQIIEYTEGKDIRAKQALLVRVNPVNATFTKDQVKLIDSKGRNLDEIITIGEPYRFEGLITRGNATETGLWVIPVSVVENTKLKDFNLTTFFEREYFATEEDAKKAGKNFEKDAKNAGKAINYAVAINNTADEAEGRFVASSYDLAAEYIYFTPASDVNFWLETKNSDGDEISINSRYVHNRWINSVYQLGSKPGIQSKDQNEAYTLLNPEQMWGLSDDAKKADWVIPASAAKKESDKLYNTVNATNDYRFYNDYFTIEKVGQKITVSLPDGLKKKAEYWYITYDFQANAVESAPSEWEAWQSYKSNIKGIYTMTRGAEDIDLVINAAAAQGDVIGFRVFAVNYDGSLLDPDGKAFYVKVGEVETIKKELTAEVLALDPIKGMTLDSIVNPDKLKREQGVNYGYAELADGAFESLTRYFYADTKSFTGTSDYLDVRTGKTVTFYWALLKSNKKEVADNWNNIKYLAVGVKGSDLKNILNNATFTLRTITQMRNDANAPVQYELVLKAKKVMPTVANIPEAYKFIWKPDYDPAVKGALDVYAIPTADALDPARKDDNTAYWMGSTGTLISAIGTATYDASAKSGERKIEDYVSGEFLTNTAAKKLYNFSIAGLTTGLSDKPKTSPYQTAWNGAATNLEGDNTVVQVLPAAIGGQYNTNMNFLFKGINGTTKTASGVTTWTTDYDYPVVAQTFKTNFKNPIDLLTYTTEYSYPVYKMNADGTLYDSDPATTGTQTVVESRQTSDKIYIKWVTDNLTGGGNVTNVYGISSKQADYLYNTPSSTLLGMIKLNSSAANIVLANDAQLLSASTLAGVTTAGENIFNTDFYSIDNTATTATEALSFEFTGNVGKYIEPVDAADLTAGFKKKGGANNPTENMEGSIKITGYDCYGKKHTFEFPIVILFDK